MALKRMMRLLLQQYPPESRMPSSPWWHICLQNWTSVYSSSSKNVYHSKEESFLILSDSLPSLQAIHNLYNDHPVLIKIHELYRQLIQEEKGIVFVWVPGHIDIRGNSAADCVAEDAIDAISRMNSYPILTTSIVWITIYSSSGNVNGMNILQRTYTHF